MESALGRPKSHRASDIVDPDPSREGFKAGELSRKSLTVRNARSRPASQGGTGTLELRHCRMHNCYFRKR